MIHCQLGYACTVNGYSTRIRINHDNNRGTRSDSHSGCVGCHDLSRVACIRHLKFERPFSYRRQSTSRGGWEVSYVAGERSEEHTSELQSHSDLVCRLLLEKKKMFKWALYCTNMR